MIYLELVYHQYESDQCMATPPACSLQDSHHLTSKYIAGPSLPPSQNLKCLTQQHRADMAANPAFSHLLGPSLIQSKTCTGHIIGYGKLHVGEGTYFKKKKNQKAVDGFCKREWIADFRGMRAMGLLCSEKTWIHGLNNHLLYCSKLGGLQWFKKPTHHHHHLVNGHKW